VILPKRNKKDVEADLPQSVKRDVEFVFISTVDQLLEEVFGKAIWRHGEGPKIEARL
jgi:ATP-dependent Lon protease